MTLQERMVAVYLRQAKLPPEEKDKLQLFLGLLLETLNEEEAWERELDRPSEEHSTAQHSTPPAMPATTFSVDPETPDGAASASSAPVHGVDEETKANDPFAAALLEALDKLGMTPESKEAEKYFGIRSSVLQKALLGEKIRSDSRERILQRVQDAGIAVTA